MFKYFLFYCMIKHIIDIKVIDVQYSSSTHCTIQVWLCSTDKLVVNLILRSWPGSPCSLPKQLSNPPPLVRHLLWDCQTSFTNSSYVLNLSPIVCPNCPNINKIQWTCALVISDKSSWMPPWMPRTMGHGYIIIEWYWVEGGRPNLRIAPGPGRCFHPSLTVVLYNYATHVVRSISKSYELAHGPDYQNMFCPYV